MDSESPSQYADGTKRAAASRCRCAGMNRISGILIGIALSFFAPLATAQTLDNHPQVPEDAFSTRELIAWSSLQKPQPTPQPLPPPDKAIPQPDQQQSQATQQQPHSDEPQPRSATTFVGKILSVDGAFALEVDSMKTYKLADEGNLSQFENKSVKIEGVLDSNDTIHVKHVQQMSR